MADENVPAPAPTRSDNQILPFASWLTIRKSNSNLDLHKKQKNQIFQISVDIIHNTNFFMAFTASASRAILSMINQCLTGKTSGHDRPSYPVLHMPWGRIHNIHQRSTSLFHLAEEDLRLGNLKFIPKGKVDEVFRMPIPNEMISNNIKNVPYYNAYLEMVAKHDKKVAAKKKGKKKTESANGVAIREPIAEATRLLPMVEGKGKAIAIEEQVAHSLLALHTPKRKSTTDQFVLQRRTLVTEEVSTGPSAQAQDDKSINSFRNSPSPVDAETEIGDASEKTYSGGDTEILQFDEEQGKDVDDQVNLKEKTNELDQIQAGSDPGRTPESQPPPE
uniref:Histone deacetylase 14 n=1 Tax=Tanacetum cinerariifolium TaxID=118510 RepID=A0A6L2LIG6_TANCI|nr:hypothetical protein [Tanacetum cinerariifolium]